MSKIKYLVMAILPSFLLSSGCQNGEEAKIEGNGPQPPVAEKQETKLTNLGQTRIDDYFWMRLSDEQKNAKQPDEQTSKVVSYLEAENAYTDAMMDDTKKLQDTLYKEMVGRLKQDDSSVPYFKNGYWYYSRYESGKEYPIYCRKEKTMDAAEEIMLDVNELAGDHPYFQVSGLSMATGNDWLAYGVDTLSRRIYTLNFINLQSGKPARTEIPGTSGYAPWANDNKTIFYTKKNPQTLLTEKVYRHTLGADPSKDVMVYYEQDKSFYMGVDKSKSGKFIIIGESSTLSSDYHILDANKPGGDFKEFIPREEEHEYTIEHSGDKFYIVTNWEAKNFRLMETPDMKTAKENWKEVLPHREDVFIEAIEVFKDFLVVEERKDGLVQLRIINEKSREEHYVDFDEPAYHVYLSYNPEYDSDKLRFVYTSLTTPNTTYEYDMNTRERKELKQDEVVGGYNPDEYVTERLSAPARDGKKVPISLVYKKGMEKNGKNPLLLYGYGSYGYSTNPTFNSARLSLLDRGFVFAIAHIRGGQELNREWYEDGKMFNKKNTFNDFIDCAEYLVDQKFTEPEELFAMGGSAGGLLMGAVANMRPDLFKGMIAGVPFVDVVSTMLDESIPLTTNEFDEWGNPKNLESYEYMLSYSPYDNVKAQDYPNMLVTTGFFDSQVQYWEPAKWVAKLRDMKTDGNTLLLETNMDVGHGGASGRFERYKETALEYAFMLKLARDGSL